MKRSPMTRKASLKRSGRLKPRSAKRAALYAGPDGRAALVARLLSERPFCEASARVLAERPDWPCARVSQEVHEPHRRSDGGDILDESNTVTICANCHRYVHEHPKWAKGVGLLVNSRGEK